MRPVLILGDGGHAAVLIEALEGQHRHFWAVRNHTDAQTHPGLSKSDLALGMGRRSARKEAAAMYADHSWAAIIHPSAIVSKSAEIGGGAQIMAGAIIQAGAKIGKHAIINTGAQVDHGCVIGDFAHICPGAVLCADVTVLEGGMVDPGVTVTRGQKALHFSAPQQHHHFA